MTPEKLLELAHEARERAYAPYSHYAVGAALLTKDGRVYQGCNIENASFSATNCAERTAFFKAVYDGCYDFAAIAVVGGPADHGNGGKVIAAIAVVGGPAGKPVQAQDEPSGPCGVCRQVMQEFCGPDFEIHMQKAGGGVFTVKLPELLPFGFTKDSMEA